MANQSYRQIASLRIGDRVASRNELTGRYGSNLITALPGRFHDDKVTMQLEGADGTLETIVTTLEHPFYIQGRGFVEAGDMKAGMKVSRWQSHAPPVASAVNSLSGFQPSAPLVQTVDYRKADSTKSLLSRWLSQASEWLGFKATLAQAATRLTNPAATDVLRVKSISITRSGLKSWRAYNLTVANDHTYFVGKQKAWVHNANFTCGDGEGLTSLSDWKFKPKKDVDWRNSGATYRDALDKAFELTGVDKAKFFVTKWAKDKNGKSIPVEYKAPNGAEVNIDIPKFAPSRNGITEGPQQPHIGYQTPGRRKNGGAQRGHIFVDHVPAGRARIGAQ